MKNQKNRSMKVHSQSGRNYKATPTIILKGQWLQEMGFEIGDYISVNCENGKLIITPDMEKAAMENRAERTILEKRYLCFDTGEQISVDMGYSIQHTFRLHDKALKEIDGFLKVES